MYIDAGDVVRVRVESDEFHDDEPGPPKAHEGVQQAREIRRPPYTITVRASPYLHAPLLAASCYRLPRSRVGASWLFGRTDTLRRRRVWFLVFDVGTGLRSDVVVEERRSRNDGRGLRPGAQGVLVWACMHVHGRCHGETQMVRRMYPSAMSHLSDCWRSPSMRYC